MKKVSFVILLLLCCTALFAQNGIVTPSWWTGYVYRPLEIHLPSDYSGRDPISVYVGAEKVFGIDPAGTQTGGGVFVNHTHDGTSGDGSNIPESSVTGLTAALGAIAPGEIIFSLAGDVVVGNDQTNHRLVAYNGDVTAVSAVCSTAPVGAAITMQVQLWHDGSATDIFASPLTIAAGATVSSAVTISTSQFATGDYFTIDVDQVGSTTPGADVTVLMTVTRR